MEWLNTLASDIPALIVICVGIALIIAEMFMPGIGLPGIAGAAFLIIGAFMIAKEPEQALVMVLIIALILSVMAFFAIRSAAKGRLWRSPIVLKTSLSKEDGFSGTQDFSGYLNKRGETRTALRPAGSVEIDGVRLDVVSEAGFVEKGVLVQVVQTEGGRVVVRPCADA